MNETVTPTTNGWRETLRFFVIALAIVLPIRAFLAQPFIVSGLSMYPTFNNRDYLIVDEITYRFRLPQRGEVIVFRPPHNKSFYIKRIIGLPGETISIKGNQISITPAGSNQTTFVMEDNYGFGDINLDLSRHLQAGEYFVLGDNRQQSSDSRYWGPVQQSAIRGRAWLRLYPFNKIAYFPGQN